MGTLYVMSKPGQPCPRERSRETISDIAPVAVPNSNYYRRRIADGSLIACDPPKPPKAASTRKDKKEKSK
jgi:hypothetical protein